MDIIISRTEQVESGRSTRWWSIGLAIERDMRWSPTSRMMTMGSVSHMALMPIGVTVRRAHLKIRGGRSSPSHVVSSVTAHRVECCPRRVAEDRLVLVRFETREVKSDPVTDPTVTTGWSAVTLRM